MSEPVPPPVRLVALLHGPDRPGLVARSAHWIYENGGNILHADQHRDPEEGIFFQRIEWEPPLPAGGGTVEDAEAQGAQFRAFAERQLGMQVSTHASSRRLRVAILVSRYDHCFHDLLLRWRAGDLPGDFVAVISNHPDLAAAAAGYGLPFHHIPVCAQDKEGAEARQLDLLREHRCDLAVMARYMQVLSRGFLSAFARPVINIHHSFLPAFAGGRPYHQAYARGVKLIGATAHYATEDLDEGPILHQDVARVTHRHGVEDLIRKGRDLEKLVLAQAVRWHLDHRVLVYGRKTVVFD